MLLYQNSTRTVGTIILPIHGNRMGRTKTCINSDTVYFVISGVEKILVFLAELFTESGTKARIRYVVMRNGPLSMTRRRSSFPPGEFFPPRLHHICFFFILACSQVLHVYHSDVKQTTRLM
jgi:hypothetical protein